jgi:hypothetical protein
MNTTSADFIKGYERAAREAGRFGSDVEWIKKVHESGIRRMARRNEQGNVHYSEDERAGYATFAREYKEAN